MLAFKPNRFFNELEKVSGYPSHTLRVAYSRGITNGLISERLANPGLTNAGWQRVQPFVATKLKGGGKLMVIFDIPVVDDWKRRLFRDHLKRLGFQQVQQSVWMSDTDYRELLARLITELTLENNVQIYEAARLTPVK